MNEKEILLTSKQVSDAMQQDLAQVRAAMARAGYMYNRYCTEAVFVGMNLSGQFTYDIVCTHEDGYTEGYPVHLKYRMDYLTEKVLLVACD